MRVLTRWSNFGGSIWLHKKHLSSTPFLCTGTHKYVVACFQERGLREPQSMEHMYDSLYLVQNHLTGSDWIGILSWHGSRCLEPVLLTRLKGLQ
jgi:hypothetical protein